MTNEQIIERLSSINMSLKQKKDVIEVIKDIVKENTQTDTKDIIIFNIDTDSKSIIYAINEEEGFNDKFRGSDITEGYTIVENTSFYNDVINNIESYFFNRDIAIIVDNERIIHSTNIYINKDSEYVTFGNEDYYIKIYNNLEL